MTDRDPERELLRRSIVDFLARRFPGKRLVQQPPPIGPEGPFDWVSVAELKAALVEWFDEIQKRPEFVRRPTFRGGALYEVFEVRMDGSEVTVSIKPTPALRELFESLRGFRGED